MSYRFTAEGSFFLSDKQVEALYLLVQQPQAILLHLTNTVHSDVDIFRSEWSPERVIQHDAVHTVFHMALLQLLKEKNFEQFSHRERGRDVLWFTSLLASNSSDPIEDVIALLWVQLADGNLQSSLSLRNTSTITAVMQRDKWSRNILKQVYLWNLFRQEHEIWSGQGEYLTWRDRMVDSGLYLNELKVAEVVPHTLRSNNILEKIKSLCTETFDRTKDILYHVSTHANPRYEAQRLVETYQRGIDDEKKLIRKSF